MNWLKFLSYLMIGFGSAPLWEKLIKYSFDVEYNFISEWIKISPDIVLILGFIVLLAGCMVLFYVQKQLSERHL